MIAQVPPKIPRMQDGHLGGRETTGRDLDDLNLLYPHPGRPSRLPQQVLFLQVQYCSQMGPGNGGGINIYPTTRFRQASSEFELLVESEAA